MAAAVQSPQSIVINRSDLERIRSKINPSKDTLAGLLREENKTLHLASEDRIKDWARTVDGLKKEKKRKYEEKLEREEAARQQLSDEMAATQAAEREAAILQAQKLLRNDRDKIKTLNSKRIMVEALKERDEQIKLKAQIKQIEKEREKMVIRQGFDLIRKQDELDDVKDEEDKKKRENVKKTLVEQLELQKKRLLIAALDAEEEGVQMRKEFEKHIQKEKRDKEAHKQKCREINVEGVKANEDLKRRALEAREQEKRDLQKIVETAALHDKRVQERKELEAEKFAQRQAVIGRMIDLAASQLRDMRGAEEARVTRQVEEYQQKQDARTQRDKEKREKELQEIKVHRETQVQRRFAEFNSGREQDFAFAKHMEVHDRKLFDAEREKKAAARVRDTNINVVRRQQEEERARREEEELREAREHEQLLAALSLQEDEAMDEKTKRVVRKVYEEAPAYARPIRVVQRKFKRDEIFRNVNG
eukprot:gnl/Hemi2/1843_TR650_c1_g1_i1.p1 gnl/Hemi2/1843_TR650_c1_g1~~gnl/Hemi2/1843_TR650_c1_g1_i1.p1  ORF type:complete len:477 (+),score=219.50 gnl/Hemi2/1843_TR650_c1_g1_i1:185-1615(+)